MPSDSTSLSSLYWTESKRPLTSVAFIAPMLVVYELAVGLGSLPNGADVWMRGFLRQLGFSQHLLLPALTIGLLLGWHYVYRESWRVDLRALPLMAVECLLLAFVLQFSWGLFETILPRSLLSLGTRLQEAMSYLGAGIYEELLFRFLLFFGLLWLLKLRWPQSRLALFLAVLASSLLFSGAHYIGECGLPFTWGSFLFRTYAGAYFAFLFYYRGFGIAAGAHALYDLLAAAGNIF